MVESQATHLKSMSIGQVIAAHLWPGLTILALFCALAPVFIAFDVPSFAAILLIEVAFLAPFVAYKLRGVSLRETGNASLRGAIPFFERSGALRYVWAVPLGLAVAIGAFEVLGPVDDALRHAAFGWLPSWLAQSTPEEFCFSATDFNSYGTKDIATGAPKRVNGNMRASDAPGLGITPIMEALGRPVLEV